MADVSAETLVDVLAGALVDALDGELAVLVQHCYVQEVAHQNQPFDYIKQDILDAVQGTPDEDSMAFPATVAAGRSPWRWRHKLFQRLFGRTS